MMENKNLKKIMTDLAAGHITQKEADARIAGQKTKKVAPKTEQQKPTRKRLKEKKDER